jgi:acetyltransferase-like isoleucine patch superfamily enzyme
MNPAICRLADLSLLRKGLGNSGRVKLWSFLGATIEPNVAIGPHTRIRLPEHVTVGSGSVLGAVQIEAWASVTIGRNVLINEARLFTGSHDLNDPTFPGVMSPITIGDYAWLPFSIIVLRGVTIGRAAVVGSGSVVTKDIPEYEVWAGNPARFVRHRSRTDFTYVPAGYHNTL